jgi:hypothetical protein
MSASGAIIGLDVLTAGGSFTSTDGTLDFSDFAVVINGALSTDHSDYSVMPIERGFRLTGMIGVADEEVGDLLVFYTVKVNSNFPDILIHDALLGFNGAAMGEQAQAQVTEQIFGANTIIPVKDSFGNDAQLAVFNTGGGGIQLMDHLDLMTPTKELDLAKDVLVETLGIGTSATISLIDQQFSITPEPSTIILLAGVGLFIGRRSMVYASRARRE